MLDMSVIYAEAIDFLGNWWFDKIVTPPKNGWPVGGDPGTEELRVRLAQLNYEQALKHLPPEERRPDFIRALLRIWDDRPDNDTVRVASDYHPNLELHRALADARISGSVVPWKVTTEVVSRGLLILAGDGPEAPLRPIYLSPRYHSMALFVTFYNARNRPAPTSEMAEEFAVVAPLVASVALRLAETWRPA